MDIEEGVVFKKETVETLQTKLRILKITSTETAVKSKVEEILNIIDSEIQEKNKSIEEIIYEKMNETKVNNKELNVKLYMLYRKLLDEKITKEDAVRLYEIYVS